jgi:hypothetical protein
MNSGKRIAVMVVLAEEDAVRTQTGANEPSVLDKNPLHPEDFFQRERVLPGLEQGPPPSLQTVARRPLPFDFKTGAAVRQQEETRGAGDQVSASPADGLARFRGKVKIDEFSESFPTPDNGTEPAGAQQVVANAVLL